MIHLSHPLHGQKHAYSELEAAADEKNGWMRKVQPRGTPHVTESQVPDTAKALETGDAGVASSHESAALELKDQYIAKFGKKPHWKMKPETIEAALKE